MITITNDIIIIFDRDNSFVDAYPQTTMIMVCTTSRKNNVLNLLLLGKSEN